MPRALFIIFIVVIGSRLAVPVGAQTMAVFPASDSILKKSLNEIVISDDHTTSSQNTRALKYSENLDEIIENQSGIGLIHRGNYASEIVMRGMNSDRLGITIDGMKVFSACTDRMDPVTSYVSANNMESMSCHNDGESKCFSSNIGGQVNFSTKEPTLNEPNKIRTNLSSGINSVSQGNQQSFNAIYSERIWAIRISGLYTKNQNYRDGTGKVIEHSQYEKANFSGGFKLKLSDRDFLLADYIRDDANNVGYPALPMDVAYARGDIYSLTYKRFLTGRLSGKITTKIYGSNIVHMMDDAQRTTPIHMDMPGQSDTYGAYILTELNPINNHEISLNLDGYYNRSFADMTMHPEDEKEMYMVTWPEVHRSVIGIYLSDKWMLNDKDFLQINGRIDLAQSQAFDKTGIRLFEIFGHDISQSYDKFLLNAALTYSNIFGNRNTIVLSANRSERLPTVSEQFGFYIFNSQDGFDYLGNPDILTEKALNAEVKYQKEFENFTMGGGVFSYFFQDYIIGLVDENMDGMTLGSNGVKKYTNIRNAEISGVDIDATANLTKWLSVKTTFTFTYGNDDHGQPLPLISPLKNSTSLEFNKGSNRFSITGISAAEQNRYSSSAGENSTPGYLICNISYSRQVKFNRQGLNLMAGIDNVFDSVYHDHLDWNDINRPGRNFYVKIQYQLN